MGSNYSVEDNTKLEPLPPGCEYSDHGKIVYPVENKVVYNLAPFLTRGPSTTHFIKSKYPMGVNKEDSEYSLDVPKENEQKIPDIAQDSILENSVKENYEKVEPITEPIKEQVIERNIVPQEGVGELKLEPYDPAIHGNLPVLPLGTTQFKSQIIPQQQLLESKVFPTVPNESIHAPQLGQIEIRQAI